MSETLRRAAAGVLRANDRGDYTVPCAQLYPHQWAWDSAFAAIGWAHLDPARAALELETLLAGQWHDGRVPHIRFHDTSGAYFPGPDVWGAGASTSITNPPVWALAAERVWHAGEGDRIAALLDAIDRSHAFYAAARDPLGLDCVAIAHPWEGGLDNSPAWDSALAQVDPRRAPPFERVDDTRVDPSLRPTDDDYRRYIALVAEIRAADHGTGSFIVYDPLMTALAVSGDRSLARVADAAGRGDIAERAESRALRRQRGLVAHLYDEALGRFGYLDARSRALATPLCVGAFMPLVADLPPMIHRRLLGGLREVLLCERGILSTSRSEAAFDARRYWRGPIWLNLHWLLMPAVGEELRELALALVAEQGFWEYFDPDSGAGLGGSDFTWSAALTLDFLHPAALPS